MGTFVELRRNATDRSAWAMFTCSAAEWHFLVELGRTYGWAPSGTTYEPPPASKREVLAVRDYEPGEASDAKQVSEADALAWAYALEVATESPHLHAMLEVQAAQLGPHAVSDDHLQTLIREFCTYASRGSFRFAHRPSG